MTQEGLPTPTEVVFVNMTGASFSTDAGGSVSMTFGQPVELGGEVEPLSHWGTLSEATALAEATHVPLVVVEVCRRCEQRIVSTSDEWVLYVAGTHDACSPDGHSP